MYDFILDLICTYLSPLIEGEFKWTLLGSFLTVSAFFTSRIFKLFRLPKFIQVLITILLICLFVWYGHEFVDPYFHLVEKWWNTGLAPHLELNMP
jgi:putative effector of murein hydrolase